MPLERHTASARARLPTERERNALHHLPADPPDSLKNCLASPPESSNDADEPSKPIVDIYMFHSGFINKLRILYKIATTGNSAGFTIASFFLVSEAGVVGAVVDRVTGLMTDGNGIPIAQAGAQKVYTASGALTIQAGTHVITKGSAIAVMTLAAPTAGAPAPGGAGGQDGLRMRITTTTAFAHTITATSLVNDGATGVPHTTITFAAFAGSSIELEAYNGKWQVMSSNNITSIA